MASHRHRCPLCQQMFVCHAEVIDNPDGEPSRLCRAEDGGQELITPVCDECREDEA